MRKIFNILFALALALSFSLMTAVPVAAAELHVGSGQTYATIQAAIAAASPGDTIIVHAGTYVEVGQIVISKNLTIIGEDKDTTIIKPAQNTTNSGDSRGWFLVNTGIQFNLSNVTLNGSGYKVYQAIRDKGSGTIANCNFNNIQFEPSGPTYEGHAMAIFGGKVDVTGCTFTAIGREGVLYYGTGVTGSTFSNNTYTGKGVGNWLDYAVDVGNGAQVTVAGNTITGCKGVASSDGSVSAAIIVVTNSQATINNNSISDNYWGVAVGTSTSDTSIVTFTGNNIYGNGEGIHFHGELVTAHCNSIHDNTNYGVNNHGGTIARDFEQNWWGDASGPYHATTNPLATGDSVSANVDYSPWWGANYIGVAHPWSWYTNDSIQDAIDAASAGDTVNVVAGTYNITSIIAINKSISIVGDPVNKPVIRAKSHFDADYHPGTAYYMLRGVYGVTATINIQNLVLDGNGYDIYGGMRFNDTHSGTIENCVFQNITEPTGDKYRGFGIVSDGSLTIQNNVFTDIGRVGIWVGTSSNTISYNVYTGKGAIDCLDYGIEVGAGGVATITGNTITNCLGIASSDGSTSAGILVTTYYGDGTTATITGNTLTDNTEGIAVGYDVSDTSTVVAHYNNINGNTDYGIHTTAPTVNATYNWWGSSSGPFHPILNPTGRGNNVSDNVTFEPWSVVENPTVTTQAATSITTTTATLNMSFTVGGYVSVNVRFAYQKSVGSVLSYTPWVSKSASSTHAALVTGLSSNTQYNFTAQLKYNDMEFGETTLNGATLQFTTLRTPPTVTTQAATDVVLFHAIFHMSYTVGDYSPVQVRFAYKKSADAGWSYTAWVSKSADGTDSAYTILLVASATQYDFKAQLKYDSTVIEGATLHFTTAIISGCFIATAAYGTPTAKQIDVLRAFRDEVLLKSTVGSQFVSLYYRFSPPIANFIAEHELLRTLVRELLVDPIVWVVETTGNMWQN